MKNQIAKIMAHMVAGFPDSDKSFEVAKALADGNAGYLEIQFPFSDPSADGPIIQTACSMALESGFKVKDGFKLIERIKKYCETPVFIMSYGSVVFTPGIKNFIQSAKDAGVSGLIIPDLMPGYDENLYKLGKEMNMPIVPVITPTITKERFAMINELNPEYLYAALRVGITGLETKIDKENVFLKKINKLSCKILAGFGIKKRQQVEQLQNLVHAIVIGSEFVKTVIEASNSGGNEIYNKLRERIECLNGTSFQPKK